MSEQPQNKDKNFKLEPNFVVWSIAALYLVNKSEIPVPIHTYLKENIKIPTKIEINLGDINKIYNEYKENKREYFSWMLGDDIMSRLEEFQKIVLKCVIDEIIADHLNDKEVYELISNELTILKFNHSGMVVGLSTDSVFEDLYGFMEDEFSISRLGEIAFKIHILHDGADLLVNFEIGEVES